MFNFKKINHSILVWLLIGCALSYSHAFAATRTHSLIKITTWKSDHGVPIYFVRTPHMHILDIRIIYAAGSVYDDKTWGLAQLVNNSVNTGAAQLTQQQIAAGFENVGALYESSVTKDMAVISLRSLSADHYFYPAVKLLYNVLHSPQFPSKQLAVIKQQTIAEINYAQQNPQYIAQVAFNKLVFNDTGYAHPSMGTAQSIATITSSMVKQFYKRYYVQANERIVLVGDITQHDAKNITDLLASATEVGKPSVLIPNNPASMLLPTTIKHIPFITHQTAINIGYHGVTRKSPDYFALMVGNHILGGNDMSSRLFSEIRNKRGLAYGISSRFQSFKDQGSFKISFNSQHRQSQNALLVVKKTLHRFVTKGPTVEELHRAQKALINSLPLSLASNNNIANLVTYMIFYQRPLNYLDTYQQHIQSVSAQEIRQAFKKIVKNPQYVVTVGS